MPAGGKSELAAHQQRASHAGKAGPAARQHARTRTLGGGELLSLGQAVKGQEAQQAELRLGSTNGASGAADEEEEGSAGLLGGAAREREEGEGWRAFLRNRLTLGSGSGSASGSASSSTSRGTDAGAGGGGLLQRSFGLGAGARRKRTGSTMEDTSQKTLLAREIPTFSTPPSILCVDQTLAPGESRTCELGRMLRDLGLMLKPA